MSAILDKVVRESFSEEQRPEGSEGGSHVHNWEKDVPGRGNSKCKGPEVGPSEHVCRTGRRPVGLVPIDQVEE